MDTTTIVTALGIPVSAGWISKKLSGPSLEVFGEILADRARLWRMKNLASIMEEAAEYAARAELDLKQLPLKALFPLLEGASFEEDALLRSKWARLLANSSATGASISITTMTAEMLRALSSADAKILDALLYEVDQPAPDHGMSMGTRNGNDCMAAEPATSGPFRLVQRGRLLKRTGLSHEEFEVSYDNITRFNVIEAPQRTDLDGRDLDRNYYAFTRLGWRVMSLLTERNDTSSQPTTAKAGGG